MKSSAAGYIRAMLISGVAALGGAVAVFSEFDDAPGGILLGFVLIAVSVALGLRGAKQRNHS